MRTFMRIWDGCAMAVTVLCLALAAAVLVPQAFGLKPYAVLSGSMEPVLPVGSAVFIDVSDKDPEISDIVAFEIGGSTITHRVVGIADGGRSYITRGDANDTEEAGITKAMLAGTYRYHVPLLGFICGAFAGPGLIAIGAALAFLNTLTLALGAITKKTSAGNGGKGGDA